jgi:hypothetical protein
MEANVQRYVVVSKDSSNKTIIGGPYLWDGQASWQPPADGTLLLESDALQQGYVFPEPAG